MNSIFNRPRRGFLNSLITPHIKDAATELSAYSN